jgi:molecular chaperone DnaJ
MEKDLYDILGVSKSSNDAEIKKAYRRLAMKHHPDRNKDNPEAEQKFKEIQAAYAVLSDSQKKQAYDQYGHAGINPNMGGGAAGGGFGDFGDSFSDIFSDLFGGGGNSRRARSSRGSDLQYDLTMTLDEAIQGKEFKIRVPTTISCAECSGSGAQKGTKADTCGQCGGSGQVRMSQGFISIQQTCPSCSGKGKKITNPCGQCRGHGLVKEEKTWSVKIPAGIDDGDRIRLEGKGEMGSAGAPGDLYVRVHIRQHSIFERDGEDLYCEAPVNIITATLGGEITIPTLEGDVKIKIPKGTQTGKRFRLRGKGITSIRHASKGDLYIQVMVETPVNLNSKQEDLLLAFGKSMEKNQSKHSPNQKTFFDSVKNFFGM